jgi:hypothetical protein
MNKKKIAVRISVVLVFIVLVFAMIGFCLDVLVRIGV